MATHITPTDIRLQLLARGYEPIPNTFKVPAMAGWNTPDYIARDLPKYKTAENVVASWARRYPLARTTGVRLSRALGMMDADLDDEAVIALFWTVLEAHEGALARTAPARFGKGTKVALAFRVDGEAFVRVASRRYGPHVLEIFGGGMLPGGRVARQFGVYGPHSEGLDYAFDGGGLAERGVDTLPGLTRARAAALVDAFDAAMVGAGHVADKHFDESAGGEASYDITAETRFTLNDGGACGYADLGNSIGQRCAGNFIAGDDGTNRTRCWIFWSGRHDCVGVYDHATGVSHYPVEKAPPDPGALADKLRDAAVLHGVAVDAAPVVPNWRERYENGSPKASLHNARLAIEACGIVGAEDTFHQRMLLGRGEAASPRTPVPRFIGVVTDASIRALRVFLSDRFGRDFTEAHVRDAVLGLCGEYPFDPVVDMLAEAEAGWDRVARLDRMAVDFFNCEDNALNRACVRKTMVAAVARARRPGCKFDTIPVLEAPEGWNKSSAWAVLAGEGNFSDEKIMGAASKEVQEQLAGVWIHENGEMAGMRKAEVEGVKAFASRTVDRARKAYGRFLTEQPRHSIEVGTTNSGRYLQSQTGNRRFWPLRVTAPIDLARLRRFRLQLWGEAAALESAGESLVLDEALWRPAAVEQEARRVPHPWEAILAELKRRPDGNGPIGGADAFRTMIVERVGDEERVSTKDLFERALGLNGAQLHRGHAMTLIEVMRVLGWLHATTRVDGIPVKGYVRPVVPKSKKVSE